MFSLSNGLSLLRAPLALLFLYKSAPIRIIALVLAMFTDFIDGFLARKRRSTTQFGAVLDPAMDKLFVFIALSVLFQEGQLTLWEAGAMLSRDFALCLFGIYLTFSGNWHQQRFKSIRWGKITTALQFLVLGVLSLNFTFPPLIYVIFVLFGFLALVELFQIPSKIGHELPK
ncbi:MAG TPA: CDP-alcohol phosphatidyltransferase family protein [Rhabdochlamydiaceae bacterium]|nr:CDP-alcohol phosphatidyltransferase family protein [Rhabdochlamydiaceae bacterium]